MEDFLSLCLPFSLSGLLLSLVFSSRICLLALDGEELDSVVINKWERTKKPSWVWYTCKNRHPSVSSVSGYCIDFGWANKMVLGDGYGLILLGSVILWLRLVSSSWPHLGMLVIVSNIDKRIRNRNYLSVYALCCNLYVGVFVELFYLLSLGSGTSWVWFDRGIWVRRWSFSFPLLIILQILWVGF